MTAVDILSATAVDRIAGRSDHGWTMNYADDKAWTWIDDGENWVVLVSKNERHIAVVPTTDADGDDIREIDDEEEMDDAICDVIAGAGYGDIAAGIRLVALATQSPSTFVEFVEGDGDEGNVFGLIEGGDGRVDGSGRADS